MTPTPAAAADDGAQALVGRPLPRAAARRLIAGRGRYTDDLRMAGMLHVAFLRSPLAHGRIVALDLAAARALPGVIAVFDGPALAPICPAWTTTFLSLPTHRSAPQPPLAIDRVLWQGQPVAMVVAESRAEAEDGVAAIEAEWEELAPVVDASAALAAGSSVIHPELGNNLAFTHAIDAGPVERLFAQAHRVIRRTLRFGRHTGVPLEARSIVAEFDPAMRQLTVHHSTQVPHQMRAAFARLLKLPEVDVRVVTPDVGGGFGIKLHVYDDEMATIAAAIKLGRPLKFVCDRLEAFASDVHARSHQVEAAIALDADGQVLAFDADDLMEIGAFSVYPRTSVLEGVHAVSMVGAPYRAAGLKGRLRVAFQNKAPVGAYRGVGQPVACSVTERLIDAAAAELGIDPAEMRRRNYRDAALHGSATVNGMDFGPSSHAACLERLLELMDYEGLREQQRTARANGRHLGIGLAAFIETTAPGAGVLWRLGRPGGGARRLHAALRARRRGHLRKQFLRPGAGHRHRPAATDRRHPGATGLGGTYRARRHPGDSCRRRHLGLARAHRRRRGGAGGRADAAGTTGDGGRRCARHYGGKSDARRGRLPFRRALHCAGRTGGAVALSAA